MLKKTSFVPLFCLISGFLLFISACSDRENTRLMDDCQSNQTNCLTLSSPHAKVFLSSEFIMVERIETITIESNLRLKEAKLIPLNMNMGIIPIPLLKQKEIESNQHTIRTEGQLFLGMCSEPVMNWNLVILFENGEVDSIPINSYWNREAYINQL